MPGLYVLIVILAGGLGAGSEGRLRVLRLRTA